MLNILIAILTPVVGSCDSATMDLGSGVVGSGVDGASAWAWVEQCGVQCEGRVTRRKGDGGYVIRRDSCGNVAIIQQRG